MASKGPRSKLDHETRARRQKALEAPREPPRPKAHWDHVLEEMIWLSKDFESERKWKLAQAKKVAFRISKSVLEHATRGEKKVKEEEQRMRKIALNISKDVKKFWTKIEKLVLYKHQLELEERKKKALDKQLDFLLGQTERYSTMLAENLVDVPYSSKTVQVNSEIKQPCVLNDEGDKRLLIGCTQDPAIQLGRMETDDYFGIQSKSDEHIIENEAPATEEPPKNHIKSKVSREASPKSYEDVSEPILKKEDDMTEPINKKELHVNGSEGHHSLGRMLDSKQTDNDANHQYHREANGDFFCTRGNLSVKTPETNLKLKDSTMPDEEYLPFSSLDELDDRDYDVIFEEEKDDETTLSDEEALANKETTDHLDEIKLLQQESEVPVEELLARYRKDGYTDVSGTESESTSSSSDDQVDCGASQDCALKDVKSSEVEQPCTVTEEPDANCDTTENGRDSEDIIADAAAAARSAQPTGNTLSTTKVRTKVPFLLKYPLREYQHIGLDWLVTMYEKRLNGILADEMGLGKTIMTIALLALLACEKGIWGPHLIVVPTSVMLNWETEFLKWCPAFKILTYFGSAKERKHKRQGWLKPNSFHICITTYRLVIQDSKVFKRKKWKYLILDEAHLIKNWKSQRWQTLLNFNSTRRILLTGTPLQNDLMELWSLMHFLMPHVFQSHQEFKDWFCNPISGMVEGQEKVNKEVVDRLHNVLRPFILRRLKRDVEKQLPKKFEHVVYCRLSKRQRNLYEDFIANSETQATLASANYFGMISVIMQLRKVCNHPDLFEGRPIISSFDMTGIDMQVSSSVCTLLSSGPFSGVDMRGLNLVFTQHEFNMTSWEADEIAAITSPSSIDKQNGTSNEGFVHCSRNDHRRRTHGTNIFEEIQKALLQEREKQSRERAASISWWNSIRCQKKPVYGTNMRELLTIKHPVFHIHEQKNNPSCYMDFSSKIADVVLSPVERLHKILDLVECFMFAIPASRAPAPVCWCNEGKSTVLFQEDYKEKCTEFLAPLLSPVRPAIVRRQVYFPDRRLIQFDCGKLQELATLLRRLKSEGHRALIFTQMTKMLDILEAFINLYGYTYMRLDGSTPPEERQTLMQRFNTNPKFFLFILSTRSGGVGINLVGADTVIFYDSDWNPAMDLQAQDRCHRIGQTREVHIYRLISESTIEENILKKANQKRILDDLVIQSGSYTTEFFKKLDPIELFSGHGALPIENLRKGRSTAVESCKATGMLPSNADVEAAIKDAEDEADYMALKRVEEEEAVDNQEFTEEATGRLDDDDLANEEETKADEKNAEKLMSLDNGVDLSSHDVNEEKALALSVGGEDIDMLADVKQLAAAAAAAGQASSSFENRLRPIDRYAMCFLDLWDPVIDKAAIEFQADVEEEEWELDRIEKLKEDMEAEIDEDQEPLLYESWDADFATMAYRQQVEALAQKQLLEDLENDAHEANNIEDDSWETNRNEASVERKVKSKKKSKKTKFKSLKKRSIASQLEVIPEELSIDLMSDDDPVLSPVVVHGESPPHLLPRKKRKKVIAIPEEENSGKSLKRLKRAHDNYTSVASSSYVKQVSESKGFKLGEAADDSDVKLARKSKTGGKISITVMPIKRVMVVKPERLKKRGNVWSKDCFPPPDVWFPQEDALLCAVVHEYGTDWGLVSDVLHDFPGGGFYRGRFRHPVHCCERFRELFYKYVLSTVECSSTEKVAPSGSGKALLKVTEDHVRTLLKVTSERPDNELLLQKHFMAVISSVWRSKCRLQHHKNTPRNGFYSSRVPHAYRERPAKLTESTNLVSLRQSSKAVWNALNDANTAQGKEPMVIENQQETRTVTEQLEEVTLHLHMDHADYGPALPPAVSVSIRSPEPPPPPQPKGTIRRALLAESSCRIAENRFRAASEACFEGEGLGWATSAFPIYDFRHRSGSTGKHKASWDLSKPPKSKVPRTSELVDDPGVFNPLLPLSRQTPTDLVEWSNFRYFILEYGDDGDCSQDPDMNFLLQETPCIEFAPDEHDLFYSELKDLGTLLEIIDFG